MSNGKGTALIIAALVVGAAGLGVGIFSVIQYELVEGPQGPQGLPGLDGIDGVNGTDGVDGKNGTEIPNTYFCSSQQELEDAFLNISTGNGQIFLTDDISLSSSIEINGGGSYVIQGIGDVTISYSISDELIVVTDVQSLVLRDFSIDTSSITALDLQGVNITEQDNDPILIENIRISGGWGRGIYINSENVWIKNCLLTYMDKGIWLDSGSGYCHIKDNTLSHFGMSGVNPIGIRVVDSGYNVLSGNVIKDLNGYPGDTGNMYGIYIEGSSLNNIVCDNILHDFSTLNNLVVIYVLPSAISTIIGNNVIYDIYTASTVYGMYIHANGSSITGNCLEVSAASIDWGIYISSSNTVVTGNTVDITTLSNGVVDSGVGTNNILSNNIVY
ncbi:MAG: hypothetical protein ACTSRE_17015 [Promethearchaeota archaeon]